MEGLKERLVWAGLGLEAGAVLADPFGAALARAVAGGSSSDAGELKGAAGQVADWLASNSEVPVPGGEVGEVDKVFDVTEGLDAADVLRLAPVFAGKQ